MKKFLGALAILSLSAACGGGSSNNTVTLTSASAINTYLEGKTMVMAGSDIPADPDGYDENTNYGSATQCYNKSTIQILSGTWNVTSVLGTLNGAASSGATGTCDTTTPSGSPLMFSSTAVDIENVQGNATCFDITVTYAGFAQDGRGTISADGKTVELELYFSGQATGDKCANGAVGASGVQLNGAAFTGNAVQTYRVQ